MARSGRRLQLIEKKRRADHIPLFAKLWYGYGHGEQGRQEKEVERWDMDAIMRGVTRGESRVEFIAEVEKRSEFLLKEIGEDGTSEENIPDRHWAKMDEMMLEVGQAFFAFELVPKGGKEAVEKRKALLAERRRLRERLGEVSEVEEEISMCEEALKEAG